MYPLKGRAQSAKPAVATTTSDCAIMRSQLNVSAFDDNCDAPDTDTYVDLHACAHRYRIADHRVVPYNARNDQSGPPEIRTNA
jgi:hypothetical protein